MCVEDFKSNKLKFMQQHVLRTFMFGFWDRLKKKQQQKTLELWKQHKTAKTRG